MPGGPSQNFHCQFSQSKQSVCCDRLINFFSSLSQLLLISERTSPPTKQKFGIFFLRATLPDPKPRLLVLKKLKLRIKLSLFRVYFSRVGFGQLDPRPLSFSFCHVFKGVHLFLIFTLPYPPSSKLLFFPLQETAKKKFHYYIDSFVKLVTSSYDASK